MENTVEKLAARYLQVKEAALDILNDLPDALVITNEEGSIQFVNKKFEFMFEWPRGGPHGIIGKTLEDTIIPSEVQEQHKSHRTEFGKNPNPRPMRGVEGITKSGKKLAVEVAINAVQTDTGKLFFAVIREKREVISSVYSAAP